VSNSRARRNHDRLQEGTVANETPEFDTSIHLENETNRRFEKHELPFDIAHPPGFARAMDALRFA
jgi:hypothetical protein